MTTAIYTVITCLLLIMTSESLYQERQRLDCQFGMSKPHPNGVCGGNLVRLHDTFCTLIRLIYPEHFPVRKRSADSTFRELTGFNNKVYPRHNLIPSDIDVSSLPRHFMTSLSASDLFLSRRHKRSFRSSGSGDIVCDCCYNQCTPRELATYC